LLKVQEEEIRVQEAASSHYSKRMMHCNLSEGLLLKVQEEEQVRVGEL
jgi:hypothetical protein